MGNPAEERRVFESFLKVAPLFAGAVIASWVQPGSDPPDIECDLVDGRKIGVELTTWVEESQIGRAKGEESLEQSIGNAIKPEPPNETERIAFLWMFPRRRMLSSDAASFRAELLTLTEEVDRRWDSERDWRTPPRFQWSDFSAYPVLGKYLKSITIHTRWPSLPLTTPKGHQGWLTFPPGGCPYSPDWMVDALCERVQAKIAKYRSKPSGVEEFYLLVHYDYNKAWRYNTSVLGIDFGYAEAVQASAARIGASVGVFNTIIVFVPVAEGQQVFSLYPS
jgi:hypothetical protein